MKYVIILWFTTVIYADISLVATKSCSFKAIDTKSLETLFMKKNSTYKDITVKVLDNSDIYDDFIIEYLKKVPTKLRIYWTRMIFTGTKKPPKKISQQELLRLHPNNNECIFTYTNKPLHDGWKKIDVIQ